MASLNSGYTGMIANNLGGPTYASASQARQMNLANSVSSQLDRIFDVSAQNNAWSAQQASDLRQWQEKQNQTAMNFSAQEAAKNRNWQEYMSNTAHQREVKDLVAAGLNPVLSAMGGSGAAVTSGSAASGVTSSGAMGQTDTSANAAFTSLLGSMLNVQTSLLNKQTDAVTALATADKYTEASKYATDVGAQATLNSANIHAMASMYAADIHADATKVAASISAAAQKYGYDVTSMTQKELASFNAEVNKELAQMGYQHDFDIKEVQQDYAKEFAELFPSNAWQSDSDQANIRDWISTLTGGLGNIAGAVASFAR